jgi:hypothetical protein
VTAGPAVHDVSSKDAMQSSIFDLLVILFSPGCTAISRRSARVSTEMSVSMCTRNSLIEGTVFIGEHIVNIGGLYA